MSDTAQLDSAAAVEVAVFCWPALTWEPCHQQFYKNGAKAYIGDRMEFYIPSNFNDLHRAAAVLVERGFSPSWHLIREEWPTTTDTAFTDWVLQAPADAWARAILQTVREIREQTSYTPSAQEMAQGEGDGEGDE